ncbi:hypothetical protein E4U42_006283 [Claviceps africana]|uniref:Uncharacterized protein n=1 Tax=Claviceps africana TaxID=83212 RepID=A0A8K0NGT3_9HYPO|nr:hypothetical protein E4U42_006283 [Claviceps africana]
MDTTTSPLAPSTPRSSKSPSSPTAPGSAPRRVLTPAEPPSTGTSASKAMLIKQEENETSILESLDTGYESDAPPVALASESRLELALEKKRYPGASTWAPDEERLFEVLFQRAERPILPGHWEVDFRGIPMLDTVFSLNDDKHDSRAIVYSRSGKDFQDLTSSVRTTVQSGLREKASPLIKKSLDKYLSWAAEDGGYAHLRYVPNMLTAELDAQLGETEITSLMEQRMRALAFLQREYLRVDRDDDAFAAADQGEEGPAALVDRFLEKMTADDAGDAREGGATDDEVVYRRKPPVVYGLFVLRTSVFLLTVDSAKGPGAYVSFHVDMHFMDRHQSVWNALTVAIAVCLARDQLARRVEDFEESSHVEGSESD